MEIVNFAQEQFTRVGASGDCPHCSSRSYFRPVGSAHFEQASPGSRIANAAQCESCKQFVLVVGRRLLRAGQAPAPYLLVAVYPLGKPDDRVDDAVPEEIKPDFREALRCRWVESYKATAAMCGRVIQASALQKGASPKKKLVEQIDELADKGIITQPVKEMAHEVRLTRNIGVHPPEEDPLKDVTQKDADDIVEFTREFLHHVYVMPAKLEARREKAQPAKIPPEGAG